MGPGPHFSSLGHFPTRSPQYSLLKWRGQQDPQRPLDSVPLEELSQEPVDGSSSRRMDWWTDCSTSHQASFFPCNHVKLSHWMTLTHWFGVTQIVYIDRNHIPRASPAQKNLNSFPWNKSLHLPWFPILSPFPNFPQTKSLLVPHSPESGFLASKSQCSHDWGANISWWLSWMPPIYKDLPGTGDLSPIDYLCRVLGTQDPRFSINNWLMISPYFFLLLLLPPPSLM